MGELTRRRLLGASAGVIAGGLGGCIEGRAPTADGGTFDVRASFFVTADYARRVAGNVAAVEPLVPFGQHGHGWEPGPQVQRTVVASDVFVYVGEGFQPWADSIVTNLRTDDADVAVVEAWEDVDLLPAGDHGADGGDEQREEDDHDDSRDAATDHDDSATDHDDADDHDHGAVDPHFWLDPTRARQAVDTIADGLQEADPGNESTYGDNADEYADRLAELDRTIEDELAGRTRDTVLFAGHNSFRYLGRRYGFRIETLTGLAPDAEPSPRDVQRAQSIIREHGIEHVLAPVFESDRAAEQLVADTDATDVLPLTPIPGITEEWNEDDWGYVDIMENVNLPTLETALGAE